MDKEADVEVSFTVNGVTQPIVESRFRALGNMKRKNTLGMNLFQNSLSLDSWSPSSNCLWKNAWSLKRSLFPTLGKRFNASRRKRSRKSQEKDRSLNRIQRLLSVKTITANTNQMSVSRMLLHMESALIAKGMSIFIVLAHLK